MKKISKSWLDIGHLGKFSTQPFSRKKKKPLLKSISYIVEISIGSTVRGRLLRFYTLLESQ
jgi:hypothetical protein